MKRGIRIRMPGTALLVALAFAGVALAQSGAYENVDPSGQTITFWHVYTQPNKGAIEDIVKAFNASNPYHITVKAEYQGNYADLFRKMLAVLGTSDAPNVVVAYQNQAATYALGNGVVDMRPLVDSAKWGLSAADKADFFPGFYASDVFASFGGARYGFPPSRSAEVMYYNSDWLKELKQAGKIDFDGPPTTPAQFQQAACAAAKTPFSKATSSGPMGYELSVDASRFASWTFAFGGDIFDDSANRFTYDSPGAQKAMTFLQGLFDKGCASIVTENYGDQTDFGAGRTLFTVGSSVGIPYYKSAVDAGAKFAWSATALPHTTPDPAVNIYGASVSLPSGHSKAADLASWLFIKYYTSPSAQAKWAEATNYFPVRKSVASEMTDYFDAHPTYKQTFDLLQYGKAEPPVPGYDYVRDEIASDMAAIMDGASVADTLKTANAAANAILADQLKNLPNR
ncbi:MAG TPA: ABC transporter substrate-binding protein [Trueperaceae bacterium]|nr:ABC transporter substrate-binding protein [Trueperaceae bacterium]